MADFGNHTPDPQLNSDRKNRDRGFKIMFWATEIVLKGLRGDVHPALHGCFLDSPGTV